MLNAAMNFRPSCICAELFVSIIIYARAIGTFVEQESKLLREVCHTSLEYHFEIVDFSPSNRFI